MKKKFTALFILMIMGLGIFELIGLEFLSCAKATYMEGLIVQDTIWTLVDSPYIISKNVTVFPNVTLTLEPGVEVRFGGEFSLIVQGRLVATGTNEKVIRFTSNKENKESGDWNAIVFWDNQSSKQSLLSNCIIEYGKNGILLGNGVVKIRETILQFNSESGIKILDGSIEVVNNEILTNPKGIEIFGGDYVIIQNNYISSNGDGINLATNFTGVALLSIEQNKIFLNNNAGINIEAEEFYNINIRNNIISQNNYGVYISTNSSTSISRNYITNNIVGMYYDTGEEHKVHFNDIFGNSLGMDVAEETFVNATYNYWGDETGPYHPSLNPYGRGNPVGGNGVNLDFLFYLTKPVDYLNTPPTAVLWTDINLAAPNQPITFVGTDSYDDGQVNSYFFDFGDGTNSSWTTLSVVTHNYTTTGTYIASLKVMDDFGVESPIAWITITVQNLPSLNVFFTLSSNVANYNDTIALLVNVLSGTDPVENATVTLYSIKGGEFSNSLGFTNSTGHFETFLRATNVTGITDVRIIASAAKSGFTDGSYYDYLRIYPPKKLELEVSSDPDSFVILSDVDLTLLVEVSHEANPVGDANVSITTSYENVTQEAKTDEQGQITFTFRTPLVNMQTNITFVVTAEKQGYLKDTKVFNLTINPRTFSIQTSISEVEAGEPATIDVYVKCKEDNKPVGNATIRLISTYEDFSNLTTVTDNNGYGHLSLLIPETSVEINIDLVVSVTKDGYAIGTKLISITVTPKPWEWPWIYTVLIIVCIGVAAAIVILVKLKIIMVFVEEESGKV
jgi:hypothetical protein